MVLPVKVRAAHYFANFLLGTICLIGVGLINIKVGVHQSMRTVLKEWKR
jgi:hypothetical protein